MKFLASEGSQGEPQPVKIKRRSDIGMVTPIIICTMQVLHLSLRGCWGRGGEKIFTFRESGWLDREGVQIKSQQYGFLNKTCIMASVDMSSYTVEISQGPRF